MRRQLRSLIWTVHLIGSLIAAVTLVGVWYGVYQPLNDQAASDEVRIAQLESLLAQPKTWQGENSELRRQHVKLTGAVELASEKSAGGAQDDLFIREAGQLAESHHLEVLDWKLGADRQVERFTESSVQGHFRGSFDSVCRFLAAINQMPRIAKMTKLALHSDGKSGDYPVYATFALYSSTQRNDTREKGGAL
ncbi:type 4a pilus biogenesis protein PilO [Adhaeretor mobilis]|uniref:Uncharacterized protein n=1 Tax=Adhaeretor mobilis TaxID=1930276 RepID=A0A517MVP9_9BACT|nr:type 4a pilus biogenesis protein PilO [Adhaeretor mobilis]QDS98949.1 hypothetical protein HG15A2_22370 [Adhaeretor mobilis]